MIHFTAIHTTPVLFRSAARAELRASEMRKEFGENYAVRLATRQELTDWAAEVVEEAAGETGEGAESESDWPEEPADE